MARLASNNNTLFLHSPSGDASMYIDPDGNMVVNSLVLIDSVDGSKWRVSISDGELVAEPLEVDVKRDFRIKKVLD